MVQIHAFEAHDISGGSPNVLVGDLDTGLDFTHPDLAPNYDAANSTDCSSGSPQPLLPGNDANGHGTHTAGTIAAAANGAGIVGVAPNVKTASIKSSNDDGYFFPEMVICSYMWVASHGIDITNNSYFADPWLYNCNNDPEQRAIKHAQQGGTLVVASRGNFASDLSHPAFDPISPDFPPGSEQEREITNAKHGTWPPFGGLRVVRLARLEPGRATSGNRDLVPVRIRPRCPRTVRVYIGIGASSKTSTLNRPFPSARNG